MWNYRSVIFRFQKCSHTQKLCCQKSIFGLQSTFGRDFLLDFWAPQKKTHQGGRCMARWWLNQPIWKNISQMGSYPQIGEIMKNVLKPLPRSAMEHSFIDTCYYLMAANDLMDNNHQTDRVCWRTHSQVSSHLLPSIFHSGLTWTT